MNNQPTEILIQINPDQEAIAHSIIDNFDRENPNVITGGGPVELTEAQKKMGARIKSFVGILEVGPENPTKVAELIAELKAYGIATTFLKEKRGAPPTQHYDTLGHDITGEA